MYLISGRTSAAAAAKYQGSQDREQVLLAGLGALETHKLDGDVFNQAMTSLSASVIEPVLASYDFSDIHKLMDVAGGCLKPTHKYKVSCSTRLW